MKNLRNYFAIIDTAIFKYKKEMIGFLSVIFLSLTMYAQSPESFNYQAVVRDGSGDIIASQAVGIQISILQTTATGTLVYRETFSPTSNAYGLVNLQIGTGTVSSGVFANIDWGSGPYFIEVAMDPAGGTSYSVTGTSQLVSVPYALYAKNSEDSKWQDGVNTGIGYFGGSVGIGTLDALPSSTLLVVDDSAGNINNIRVQNTNAAGVTRMNITSDNNTEMVFGINNSSSAFGPNEAFFWYFNNFDMKFGTNSTERLRIKANGNLGIGTANANSKLQVTNGDMYIETVNNGVIMKSPDGNCWRLTVSNAGAPVFTAITCP